MARIGVIPTKTSLELREPDGDAGTLPAASESSAGVMTARHVQMLEEVYGAVKAGGGATIIMERSAPVARIDTSEFVRRTELGRMLADVVVRMPEPAPVPLIPVLPPSAAQSEVEALRDAVSSLQRTVEAQERTIQVIVTLFDDLASRVDSFEQKEIIAFVQLSGAA